MFLNREEKYLPSDSAPLFYCCYQVRDRCHLRNSFCLIHLKNTLPPCP